MLISGSRTLPCKREKREKREREERERERDEDVKSPL
jgi:hypothetical protein